MTLQPPVAKYNLSAVARDEFARVVARKQRWNIRGSELQRQVRALDSSRLETPCTVMMYDFEKHKRDSDEWLSEPFYTAPQGYKLNLSVYPNGNGDGKDTHVSIFLQLMPGEFDDRLRWPFRGSFIVKLLDQSGNRQLQDIEEEISFSSRTRASDEVTGKPTYRENRGLGKPKFAAQRDLGLYTSCLWSWRGYPVYIDEDCCYFQVTKI